MDVSCLTRIKYVWSCRGKCALLDPDGNGIQLSLAAKKEIVRGLLDCIVELVGRRPTFEGMWPFRDEFRSLLPKQ